MTSKKKKVKQKYKASRTTWRQLDDYTKEELLDSVRDIYNSWRANNGDKRLESVAKHKIISIVIGNSGMDLHRESVSQFFLREMDKIEGVHLKAAHKEKKEQKRLNRQAKKAENEIDSQ